MAKNKNEAKFKKVPKNQQTKRKIKEINLNKNNKTKNKVFTKNINYSMDCNDTNVLELMTKHPELNQTFEYILYSNKYKHTITDVTNIIKMLMSKLDELHKDNVDLQNTYETINLNYKIKGLVQSTAINLSHVVDQLNINETTFLNFARNFTPSKPTNEKVTENIISFDTNKVSEEPTVSNSSICNYGYPSLSIEIKPEKIDCSNTDIFGCNYTIILSSDDENEESSSSTSRNENLIKIKPKNNDQDIENYIIGSDINNILLYDNDVISSSNTTNCINNTIASVSSQHLSPLPKVKKIKQTALATAIEFTHEARKSDFALRKRLIERNREILVLVKQLNLQGNNIVLEFDTVNKKPLITIHKELAKVLKKHQIEGIRFLWNIVFETVDKTNTTDGTGCILAHRMGIGKTLQIIVLIYTILCHTQINLKTFLIICPPGLIYNWMDEIYKWLKDIDKDQIINVYDLPKTNKLYNITNIATWKSNGGILILSYDNFKSLVNCKQSDLREGFIFTLINPGPDVVILDEGHYIKNTNTVLLKSLTQIRTKRRIVLTGTPMQNSLKEYYTMVDFVKPNILGNFKDFTTTFIKPINGGQFIDSSDEAVKVMKQRTFILHKLLENSVHRIDDQNLKLLFTEKIEYTIELNMTEFQCELYQKFLHYNKTTNDTSTNVFLRLHILTLITLHPLTLYRLIHYNTKQPEFGTVPFNQKFVRDLMWVLDYKDDARFFEAHQSNKIKYLLSTIDECQNKQEKILCFLKSPLALDALEYFLQKEKNWVLGKDYLRMDGKTPLSIRNQMCEVFNNPDNPVKLFILSVGTSVLGYNMVGANRVLLLNTSWNPSNDIQAIYRCLRFGQKKTVYVNRLLAKGTIEPKAYYRQISKLGMASSVVDLQHMSRKVSFDQINDLFSFDLSKHYSILHSIHPNTKDPVLNQLIRSKIGFISDLKEHDSMLVESVEDQLTLEERRSIWQSFKNDTLQYKSLTTPKLQNKLQNNLNRKTHTTQIINEDDIKQESNNDDLTLTNSFQCEQEQVCFPNRKKSFNSNLPSTYYNNPNPKISPFFTRKRTNVNFTNERNQWKKTESIQNQFKHFQNKTFSRHKRYPIVNNRPYPVTPRIPSATSTSKTTSEASISTTPPAALAPRYSSNDTNSDTYKTLYNPNYRTPTENNIENRSGMSR